MWSGIVSQKRAIKPLGIHQKLDTAAFAMVHSYFKAGSFPTIDEILHFEGANGPDGLKLKSPGLHEPSHLYDPTTDTGEVPMHITNHYRGLVKMLRKQDMVRASFEAAWLAHYVVDGLTPAHHFPLEEELAALQTVNSPVDMDRVAKKIVATGNGSLRTAVRKNWKLWGAKGLLSTHLSFEGGVASVLLFYPIRGKLNMDQLAKARQMGPLEFFKAQAREVAEHDLYDRYLGKGWSIDLAQVIRKDIAPRTAQTVGIIWLLAYLEAGLQDLTSGK